MQSITSKIKASIMRTTANGIVHVPNDFETKDVAKEKTAKSNKKTIART
jgi:hypothetical protein